MPASQRRTAIRTALLAFVAFASIRATVLQKLSMDEMIRQSTGIVRARVTGSRSVQRGATIYTLYRVQVLEAAKASPESTTQEIEVAVPGGVVNGIQQIVPGAPNLTSGSEYVLFLWTGKSGLTQIIGLSQGLFGVTRNSSGKINLTRRASEEPMVDKSGHPASSPGLDLSWLELRRQIRKDLGEKNLAQREAQK